MCSCLCSYILSRELTPTWYAGQPLEDSMDEEPYQQQQQRPQQTLSHSHQGLDPKGGGSRPVVNASLGSMSQWTLADEQSSGGDKDGGEQVGLLSHSAAV